MNENKRTKLSKYLSLILRHKPQVIGIKLDSAGWVSLAELLVKSRSRHRLTEAMVLDIVNNSPKKRFAISDDGLRIRASQGHSYPVDLGYKPSEPPQVLYHGTIASVVAAIAIQGLNRQQRQHVHLSKDRNTAEIVGKRRGKPIVLQVQAAEMAANGYTFYLSDNGVWLTDAVPPECIVFPK